MFEQTAEEARIKRNTCLSKVKFALERNEKQKKPEANQEHCRKFKTENCLAVSCFEQESSSSEGRRSDHYIAAYQ